jgi:hypothetical protein
MAMKVAERSSRPVHIIRSTEVGSQLSCEKATTVTLAEWRSSVRRAPIILEPVHSVGSESTLGTETVLFLGAKIQDRRQHILGGGFIVTE